MHSNNLLQLIAEMPHAPGVYRMLDANGTIIYVGKARDLKQRVASYFHARPELPKTQALLARVQNIEITVTRNEIEALVLENQLIKAHQPRYNILLRDDKGYLYIHLTTEDEFPRISYYRGTPRGSGRFFGPYPSTTAVRETIAILEKLFRIRNCSEQFFSHRSRPCLQHQLGRCDAPCVNLITQAQYANGIQHALLFLSGKDEAVRAEWAARMESAAQALDFEQAARYRDQIIQLRRVQDQQLSDGAGRDLDVVAVAQNSQAACVTVLALRGGYHRGHHSYFPRLPTEDFGPEAVLAAFLPQYYLGRAALPEEILLNHPLEDCATLAAQLSAQSGQKIAIVSGKNSRQSLIAMATHTAEQALALHQARRNNYANRLQELAAVLGISPPERIECFDVSHTQGEATVAACVVFGISGAIKSAFRRFNISGITPGDDYAALRIALIRRYRTGESLPQLLMIDGGAGQFNIAMQVVTELHLSGVYIIGIAKGVSRIPGQETIFTAENTLHLPPEAPALHLIQEIRDAAHHFAITGHRQRRARMRRESILAKIPGIGPQRRRLLLNHFGGLQELRNAAIDDLARLPGISNTLAEKIYIFFHPKT